MTPAIFPKPVILQFSAWANEDLVAGEVPGTKVSFPLPPGHFEDKTQVSAK